MFHTLRASTLLLVGMFGGFTQSAQPPDYQLQAKVFVNAMAGNHFSDAVTTFDETMGSVMPADKLAATWQQIIAQAGEFKSTTGTRQVEFKSYQIVFVSCHFANSDLDAKVVYDVKGRIAGLFFVPPQAQPPVPAAGAAAVERTVRPQEPKKPYPYREEDVGYDNPAGNDRLAATLTIPNGKGPFPAVVLITGSGPQDRDETVFNHKPFLVLADYLTRKGIAVLRADDRGVGKSTGKFDGATTADFATDTEAGVAYLKTRPEIEAHRIGLIGHSEGGIIAPMIAARSRDVAFIVMMAGSSVPGDEILVAQVELLTEASGKSHEEAMKAGAEEEDILSLLKNNPDPAAFERAVHEKFAQQLPGTRGLATVKALESPWLRYFVTYDPAVALRKVTCPVLALNGEKDLQVPPKQNLPAIRAALEAAGNKNFEIDEMPGLNHLFQDAKTGLPKEYGEIEETISPAALEKISGWILKLNAQAGAR